MNFGAIPHGTSLFLDANTFIYSFGPDPVYGPASAQLLERIENHELQGLASSHVLSEVAHRLMALEAMTVLGWAHTGIANRLKRHPDQVKLLSRYRQSLDEIAAIGIQIVPVRGGDVSLAADVSGQFGLLCSDALIVIIMRQNGLIHLASNDADFDIVPGIVRCSPI